MRILFVDQFSESGGAQRCFLDLLPAIEERGWTVEAAIPGDGPLAGQLHSTPIACGPYRSGRKSARDGLRFAFDLCRQTHTLSQLIARGRFDLLYVNGPRVLPGAVLAARGRVPILFHAHNFLPGGWAARLAGWSVRGGVEAVVACSEAIANPLGSYIAPAKLHVIYNGSPDIGYRQRAFERPFRIGIIGRIEPQKGQLEFVEAARLIPQARFLIFGSCPAGSSSYHDRLREQTRYLPVEFCGWQPDRTAVFAGLDLLVIASREEGLPLVMLEAFSAGVPVVAFPVGGIPEVIEDEVTGFLVPEGTSEGLALRICKLMTGHPERLRLVAASARAVWEQSHHIKLYRDRMLAVLSQVASGTGIPPGYTPGRLPA